MHIIQEARASVRSYKLIIIVVTLLCITSLNAIANSTITITADNTNLEVGESIKLTVTIDNVEKVFGIEFVLQYNPAVVSINNVAPGEIFTSNGGSMAGPATDNPGAYRWSYMRHPGDPEGFTGSGVLAYIDMIVVGNGSANITLTNVLVANILGENVPVTVNANVTIKVGSDEQETNSESGGEGSTSQTNGSTVTNKISVSTVADQTSSLNGNKKVRLAVNIDNANGVSGVVFVLYYNPQVVSIAKITPGEIFRSVKGSISGSARDNPGAYSWSYQKNSGDSEGFSGDGVAAYIDVTASGNGPPEISLNDVTLTNSSGEKIQATVVAKDITKASFNSNNASRATNKRPATAMTGQTIPFVKRLLVVLVILGILGLVHLYLLRPLMKSNP